MLPRSSGNLTGRSFDHKNYITGDQDRIPWQHYCAYVRYIHDQMAPARTHLLPAVHAQCASMVKLRVELVIVISFGKLLMGMLVNSPTKSGFCWTAAGFEAFFCRSHLNYP